MQSYWKISPVCLKLVTLDQFTEAVYIPSVTNLQELLFLWTFPVPKKQCLRVCSVGVCVTGSGVVSQKFPTPLIHSFLHLELVTGEAIP